MCHECSRGSNLGCHRVQWMGTDRTPSRDKEQTPLSTTSFPCDALFVVRTWRLRRPRRAAAPPRARRSRSINDGFGVWRSSCYSTSSSVGMYAYFTPDPTEPFEGCVLTQVVAHLFVYLNYRRGVFPSLRKCYQLVKHRLSVRILRRQSVSVALPPREDLRIASTESTFFGIASSSGS
jgi:hypothetical protein